jgi:uncharacterized membrane protein YhaH (DUF805 family)
LRYIRRLFSFFGRADRREYWLVSVLGTIAVWWPLYAYNASSGGAASTAVLLATVASVAAGQTVNCAVGARRLHDRGRTAWWLLLYFALPLAALLTLGTTKTDSVITTLLAVAALGPVVAGVVIMGLLPGQRGPNRFDDEARRRVDAAIFD